jgi:hypothetical protein
MMGWTCSLDEGEKFLGIYFLMANLLESEHLKDREGYDKIKLR